MVHLLHHQPGTAGPADLVITGVRVWTGTALGNTRLSGARLAGAGLAGSRLANAGQPADAVAIRGDRIVAVGRRDDVLELAGRSTRRWHLPGRMLIPGFQDAHVHPPFAGRYRLNLSLHGLASVEEYLEAIARYAASNPELPWIYGAGWEAENFGPAGPTR
jgi:predicted amidohydrolase YtcJ